MKIKMLLFCGIILIGCSKSTPRKPINPKPSTTIFQKTIEESKQLNKVEEEKIEQLIEKDSTNSYTNSLNGFWYTYVTKIEADKPTPKTGDIAIIEFDVRDLNDTIIYSKEELGIKKYNVDKEDFISGIQKGIKLMKIGETITFVIPSYNAFGISGDGNKIGVNKSIKSTVTLLNIK
ncbi:gliding motility-associated peptidyl-prolyl isomerase GldI [Polaribacter haliotis]|uniref:Peptidyl-prolyl cis-trans isomerase n=1 Tax=Polaribacter haliotis TaxID=1888915 RepID=A0A7L8AGU7_9FLAO|nr:gliding motility-associated peptidyl-prolyl isomerase GldI [Polaribacter haliotis]QOD61202.1 gliding motility-associated peptidyl-prolyl isomerase GldI [Polaribacter haliotis]